MNAIDGKTKFVLAHSFVGKRTKEECVKFLKQIKDNCYDQIIFVYENEKHKKVSERELITFVCDGFENYKSAFNKLFYRTAELQFGVPIAFKKYNLKHNNNPVERYNGKIRSGFKSFENARNFMNLRRTIYNFINPHQELYGITPAEKAGVDLELGRNKLLNLIIYLANRGM